jgi:hypothetical protein
MSSPSPLPDWMIIFAFIASVVLTVLKVLEFVFDVFRKSKLEIALTRDLFFRVLPTGECLYVPAVFVAYEAGALIKEVEAALKKQDGATKEFTLKVAQAGEQFRTPEGLFQYSFHATSPLMFIPESNPQRQVYLFEHDSYAEATRREFRRYEMQISALKENYSELDINDGSVQNALLTSFDSALNKAHAGIMDQIQIEPGKYRLTMTVKYQQKGRFVPWLRTKQVKAQIQFVVGDEVRRLMNHLLQNYLYQWGQVMLLDQEDPVLPMVEYRPIKVTES